MLEVVLVVLSIISMREHTGESCLMKSQMGNWAWLLAWPLVEGFERQPVSTSLRASMRLRQAGYFGGEVISMAQIAAGRIYIEAL